MTIGQRIKNRRLELKLSVDEVADKLKKNRATVYRYENDDIKEFPITVLEPLAKVLETTPADLMGWEEDDELQKYKEARRKRMDEHNRNYFDSELNKSFPKLNDKNKKKVISYSSKLLEVQEIEENDITIAAHPIDGASNEDIEHDNDIMDDDNF